MKIKLFYALMIGLTFIFTACPEEETIEPYAYFEVSPNPVKVGETVSFNNLSEDTESVGWTFGDGSISTDWSPTHIYDKAGTYTILLTAYNKSKKDQFELTILVEEKEDADIDPSDYNGIPSNQFYDYFIADFESGDGGFYTGTDDDYSAQISNGHYVITNYDLEYDQWFSNSGTFPDNNSYYQLEYILRTKNYEEPYGSGVQWAMNDNWDHLFNIISPFGGINMGYSDDTDGWVSWSEWVTGGNESPEYNKITIRKYGDTYYVFRNEIFVYEHPANVAYGDRFGVIAGPTQTIEFNEITIRTINSEKAKSVVKYKATATKVALKKMQLK